jgi:prevent-host-death family protein
VADISVSVHELKAKLSEFLGRSIHGKERVIIRRRNKPIAMIVPLPEGQHNGSGGLLSVDWGGFESMAPELDIIVATRQDESFREISF